MFGVGMGRIVAVAVRLRPIWAARGVRMVGRVVRLVAFAVAGLAIRIIRGGDAGLVRPLLAVAIATAAAATTTAAALRLAVAVGFGRCAVLVSVVAPCLGGVIGHGASVLAARSRHLARRLVVIAFDVVAVVDLAHVAVVAAFCARAVTLATASAATTTAAAAAIAVSPLAVLALGALAALTTFTALAACFTLSALGAFTAWFTL